MNIDEILQNLSNRVAKGENIPSDVWLDYAFRLNALILTVAESLEDKRQKVAKLKLEALKEQVKRNVAAAEMVVETLPEFKEMKMEEAKLDQIKEFIRIAKLNTNLL